MTRYEGTDRYGGQWTGNSYEQDGTTFYEFNGPQGQLMRCWSYKLGLPSLVVAAMLLLR
jgi:hypothetical protein